jgi:hypothetical protein
MKPINPDRYFKTNNKCCQEMTRPRRREGSDRE